MADTTSSNGASALLESTSHIFIAQLTPLLVAPSTRSVKTIVTLTWPYSSATGSVAFLLVEPDFRLRRTRGQVRVQFSGSSAKAVAKSGIASGDEVILSLDGVEWVEDETPFATPGRGVEFELKFAERLLLQFRQEDSQETNLIDIDHPTPEPEAPSRERIPSPEVPPSPYASPYTIGSLSGVSSGSTPVKKNGDEYSSPAWTKRGRITYGSLFDKAYDPFEEEDGSVRGKGRKRTRLSSAWRYQSRSPSPEIAQEHTLDTSSEPMPQPTPIMTDEACQTVGLEDGDAAELLADFHKQATNIESSPYRDAIGEVVTEVHPRGEVHLELSQKPADLPTIQTQQDGEVEIGDGREACDGKTPPKAPDSPRLQPLSSDGLPFVSPLITSKYIEFFGKGDPHRVVPPVPNFSDETPDPMQESVNVEEQDDLYGASPVALHGQAQMFALDGFQEPSGGINALEEASNIPAQFLSEHQYGDWQAANAQLSPDGSLRKSVEEMGEEQQDTMYVEGEQEDGFPIPGPDPLHVQHYPDPEEESHSHPVGTSWGFEPTAPAYPDLPQPEEGAESHHVAQEALRSGPVTMSRSGSAQSAAIDLTESDEEAVEEYEEDTLKHPIDEDDYARTEDSEESVEDQANQSRQEHSTRRDDYRKLDVETSDEDDDDDEDEDEDEDREEGSLEDQPMNDRRLPDHSHVEDDNDVSQNSQDEEELYEDDTYEEKLGEGEEQYRGYPQGFDPEQEGDFEDEEDEGSYDEDMEEYDQSNGPVQKEPVVIDLLSSDEEDSGDVATPNFEPETPPGDLVEADEAERSDSDEGLDAEEDLSTESQEQAVQPLTEDQSEDDQDQEEDELVAVEASEKLTNAKEKEDNFPDTENESSVEKGASDDGDYAEGSHQDTANVQPGQSLEAEEDPFDVGGHTSNQSIVDQDTEMAQPDEDLSVEDLVGAHGKASTPMEEVEFDSVEESLPPGRPALEEVERNRELLKAEEQEKASSASEIEAPIERPSTKLPPPRPTPFAQMFNLDGANDDRLPSLYPILPREEDGTLTAEALPSESASQLDGSTDTQSLKQANGQLPTPEATQLSLVKESSDILHTSETTHTTPSEPLKSTSDELVVDPALETAMQPMEGDPITQNDEPAANSESRNIGAGTEATGEETAKITLEETMAGIIQDAKAAPAAIELHNLRSRTRQQNGSLEPAVHVEVQAAEQGVLTSPRRSHRRGKSTSSVTEASQTKVPTTPSNSATTVRQDEPASAPADRSPSGLLDERISPKGHDASIEFAMSALDSPVKTVEETHVLRSTDSGGSMKLKLMRALRTELSEFTALKVLRYHKTKKLDVLSIATTVPAEPERAKGGPRHYQITFNITDHSIAPGGVPAVTEVQVFRPYKDALPIVKVGDGILLRNFLVVAAQNKGFVLQSTDSSSWAVFRGDDEDDVEVRGPPVEYGAGEQKHIKMLRRWYSELEPAAMDKIAKANGDEGAGKGMGKVF